LGCIGWYQFYEKSNFWKQNKKLYNATWIFFWILNSIPLLFVSTAYSHRSRVEAMVYLSEKNDFHNLIVEESNHEDIKMPPLFYLRHWVHYYSLTSNNSAVDLKKYIDGLPETEKPNYIVFNQQENIEERLSNFKKAYPDLIYETTIEPSFIDKVMHRLNKHNANFTSYVYKIGN
jgi:hypothetical protein